jgi:hypothetical protein
LVWEDDLREAGSCSNPRTHPNWMQHDTRPNGPKIWCRTTVGRKKSLHQNDDCGRLRHDMDLRFDVYESRVQDLYRKYCTPESKSIRGRRGRHKLLLFWNLNVTGTNSTPFPSYPLFLSNKTEHMFPLSK